MSMSGGAFVKPLWLPWFPSSGGFLQMVDWKHLAEGSFNV